jgi:N-acetylneuraminic acid mutarotase
MPTARWLTAAVVEKNIIYVIGGVVSPSGFVATVESYNPATNTWTEEAPMLESKQGPAAGLLETTIVVADGAPQPGQITGDAEGYDAATNAWTELAVDPEARVLSCFGSIGSKFYDAGGYLNNAGAATTVNESFQLSKNKWTTTLAPMPQGTMQGSSAVYKKQLYCIGGLATWNGAPINNVQIYQP